MTEEKKQQIIQFVRSIGQFIERTQGGTVSVEDNFIGFMVTVTRGERSVRQQFNRRSDDESEIVSYGMRRLLRFAYADMRPAPSNSTIRVLPNKFFY